MVTGFGGDHKTSYTLRQVSGKAINHTFHGDHLSKFHMREGYLIPEIESAFPEYQNLRVKQV